VSGSKQLIINSIYTLTQSEETGGLKHWLNMAVLHEFSSIWLTNLVRVFLDRLK